jgi:cytoskeletal protein CcmA (bactofilin family)
MIGSKKPEEKPCSTVDTLVGDKTELKGDILFTGGLRVDGKVRGNVTARGDNNSTLVVSEAGEIDGSVDVPHVVINGTINGNLNSAATVELQSKARVFGDVHYKALKMDLGAAVNGNLVCEPEKSETARLKPATPAVATGTTANS